MTETGSPLLQLGALAGNDIFVEYIQPARRSAFFSENDRPASRTASAIAARLIAPSYSAMISSQGVAAATNSKIWSTMIRVPMKVGVPWQIRGSETTYSPRVTRVLLPCAV